LRRVAVTGTHHIAVVGGDGIGPEVFEAGCRVLDALAEAEPGLCFAFTRFGCGSDHYRRTGTMMRWLGKSGQVG